MGLMLIFIVSSLFFGIDGLRPASTSNYASIKVVAGSHWSALPQALTYEAVIPLVYKIKWKASGRKTPDPHMLNCGSIGPVCNALNTLRGTVMQVSKLVDLVGINPLFYEPDRDLAPINRGRRSIDFIGKALHWCCGVATKGEVASIEESQLDFDRRLIELSTMTRLEHNFVADVEVQLENYTNTVDFSVSEIRKRVLNLQTIVKSQIFKTTNASMELKGMMMTLTDILAQNLFTQGKLTLHLRENEALHRCQNKLLPISVFPVETLQRDLDGRTEKLAQAGYEWAVANATEIATLKVSHCVWHKEEMIIRVNAPIVKMGAKWSLFEIKATPFAWHGQTCSITHETVYAAIDGKRFRTISGPALHDCKVYSDKLCFLPRYSADTTHGPTCAIQMFKGGTTIELSRSCHFSCRAGAATIISEVGFEQYIITHPPPQIRVHCDHSYSKAINSSLPGPGALELTLSCDRTARLSESIVIPSQYPCNKGNSQVKTTHILPAIWSTLDSMIIDPKSPQTLPTFEKLADCLNKNWTLELPHLNLTQHSLMSSDTCETIYMTGSDGTVDGLALSWNLFLTLFLGVLTYFVYKHERRMPYLVLTPEGRK